MAKKTFYAGYSCFEFRSGGIPHCATLISSTEQGEDHEEDVDDVDVELQRSHHVLLRPELVLLAAHHELHVERQEQCEEQSSQASVDNLNVPVVAVSENGDEAEEEEAHGEDEEEAGALGEVELGLHGEQDDREAHHASNAEGNHDGLSVVEAGNCSGHVRERHCEYSEEDEVLGVFPPDAFAADQGYVDGEEEDVSDVVSP